MYSNTPINIALEYNIHLLHATIEVNETPLRLEIANDVDMILKRSILNNLSMYYVPD